jgi:hypothetical protein
MNSTTTSFYSSKRNKNVNIPNDKVCGYRIRNEWMKKGYSDGLKADRNNGVVDQRLSRFANEYESVNAMNRCKGNVNWLNHKTGMGFNKPESADNQFIFKRPAFKAGQTIPFKQCDSIDGINKRGGMGNRYMSRPNFKASEIKGRFAFTPDFIKSLSYGEVGLSTSNKLNYTMTIRIPDPTDFEYLRERKRIIGTPAKPAEPARPPSRRNPGGVPAKPAQPATGLYLTFQGLGTRDEIEALIENELRINPPLGRPQRTIATQSNTSTTGANNKKIGANETKIRVLQLLREVRDGRAENRMNGRAVINELAKILTNTQADLTASTDIQAGIGKILDRVNVPLDYRGYFGDGAQQIVGEEWLKRGDNKGKLRLFFMANARTDDDLTLAKPIYDYAEWTADPNTQVKTAIEFKLTQFNILSALKRKVFDLHRRGRINLSQAKSLMNIDGTQLGDPEADNGKATADLGTFAINAITNNRNLGSFPYVLPTFGGDRGGRPQSAVSV